MLKWFLAILLLAASAGMQYWVIQRRSARVCRAAAEIAEQAPRMRAWLAESLEDPFLQNRPLQGSMGSVLTEARQRSRWISSEENGSRLPPHAQKAFRDLAGSSSEARSLIEVLFAVSTLDPPLQCEQVRLPAGEDEHLHSKVVEASRAWEEEKKRVEEEKIQFAADRQIYCKGDELLFGLRKVLAAQEARCQQRNLPPKAAAACKAGKNEALAAEVADLEAQKEFNLKKLRAKWPPAVLETLSCERSS